MISLCLPQRSKESPFDLDEFFQALPRKQRTKVWEALLSLTHSTVDSLSEMVEEDKVCRVEVMCDGAVNLRRVRKKNEIRF